jgi:hypothetical protein
MLGFHNVARRTFAGLPAEPCNCITLLRAGQEALGGGFAVVVPDRIAHLFEVEKWWR